MTHREHFLMDSTMNTYGQNEEATITTQAVLFRHETPMLLLQCVIPYTAESPHLTWIHYVIHCYMNDSISMCINITKAQSHTTPNCITNIIL